MPLTVKDLKKKIETLPDDAILIDFDNSDYAISEIEYDHDIDNCYVKFEERED